MREKESMGSSGKLGVVGVTRDRPTHVSEAWVEIRPCRNGFVLKTKNVMSDFGEEWVFPDSKALGLWIAGWDKERGGL